MMENDKNNNKNVVDCNEKRLCFEYKNSWIKKMVINRKTYLQVEKERGYDDDYLRKSYYWEFACVSKAQFFEVDARCDADLIWEYRLYARVESKSILYKPILMVKQSNIDERLCGLFAKIRFSPGEAITVISQSEEGIVEKKKWNKAVKGERLVLGGCCALNAKYYVRDKCNAVVGQNGVVRAIHGIAVGDEIMIDFDESKFHPAQLVDAVIWTTTQLARKKKKVLARVDGFKRDGNGGFKYVIKLKDGAVKEVSKEDILNNAATETEMFDY